MKRLEADERRAEKEIENKRVDMQMQKEEWEARLKEKEMDSRLKEKELELQLDSWTDSTDSPDCLPILLSISVFSLYSSCSPLLVFRAVD